MATTESTGPVPKELTERYRQAEAPTFEAVRTHGTVRLWRTTTKAHQLHDFERPAKVHYHVTVGEEASCLQMPDFETALANFEMVVREESTVERRVLRSRHFPSADAFGNTDVVLERAYGDYWRQDDVGFSQSEDEPVHLFVGAQASDEKLQRAAERFGLDLADLQAFRDGKDVRHG